MQGKQLPALPLAAATKFRQAINVPCSSSSDRFITGIVTACSAALLMHTQEFPCVAVPERGPWCTGLLAALQLAQPSNCISMGPCPNTPASSSTAAGSSETGTGNKRSAISCLSVIPSFLLLQKKEKVFPSLSVLYYINVFCLRVFCVTLHGLPKYDFLDVYPFYFKILLHANRKIKVIACRPQSLNSPNSRYMLSTCLASAQIQLTLLRKLKR